MISIRCLVGVNLEKLTTKKLRARSILRIYPVFLSQSMS